MMRDSYDVIVVGGGPAGSTVATLLAKAGHSVLLLEREKHPRFHVGESLMPECYWIFDRLGLVRTMQESDFVKKVSVQFVGANGKQSQPFYFDEHDPRDCSTTWQVERARFDQLLFDNAARHGADCVDETRVLEVVFDGTRARGVRLQTATGETREISARVVVDATGQQALLASALGIKRENPDLRKAAIWTYYRDARRDEGKNGGATVILHTRSKDAWFWFIPLANEITSIGVVGDHTFLLKRGQTPDAVYETELGNCVALQERLTRAERVDKHHVIKEFSYLTERAAGDGWTLVGDAWGFIDPIYSSGVFFAFKSGELAADAIHAALEANDTSAARLGVWADEFAAATTWIRKLVGAFYTKDFSFGQFMQANPDQAGPLTDLLIGRIFHSGAGDIFNRMDPMLARATGKDE